MDAVNGRHDQKFQMSTATFDDNGRLAKLIYRSDQLGWKYDVTVHIITFERNKEIAWNLGPDVPFPHFYGYRLEVGQDGVTNVTSYYDWSKVTGDIKERFPIVPESALRATLGILERTVRKGL